MRNPFRRRQNPDAPELLAAPQRPVRIRRESKPMAPWLQWALSVLAVPLVLAVVLGGACFFVTKGLPFSVPASVVVGGGTGAYVGIVMAIN